jgi:crotonobetainyl-CoA:carnitine CoA-transferase CaiB-like acyl-CoA transferase
MQPLTGCTVLDFSTLLPGPLATLMLAEAGATVLKVERPGGEEMRAFPPFFSGGSAPYALLNRGKTAVTLDLKSEAGRVEALRLMRSADVVVEQFRPGVMTRLGLDYAAARARNPAIIYCSITGYGQSGPRAGEAGHDINYLANTGLLSLSWGAPSAPALPPAQIADIGGGSLPAVVNILLALLRRERTGEGAHLDIAMSDAMFTFAVFAQAVGAATGRFPGNREGFLAGGSPRYGLYVARCGAPIAVGALEDRFWTRLCDVLGLGSEERDDAADPRRARAAVASAIAARDAAEWAPLFAAADCCATPLVSLEAALADRHFRGRGLFAYEVGDQDGYLPAAVVPVADIFRDRVRRKPAPRLGP